MKNLRFRKLIRCGRLDLDVVLDRLVAQDKRSKKFWLAVVPLYRAFLSLKATYPELKLAPVTLVDELWHAHILDTRKYARDCERLFGKFIHHMPIRPELKRELVAREALTLMLVRHHFGPKMAGGE